MIPSWPCSSLEAHCAHQGALINNSYMGKKLFLFLANLVCLGMDTFGPEMKQIILKMNLKLI